MTLTELTMDINNLLQKELARYNQIINNNPHSPQADVKRVLIVQQ
ncbi:MAG: hypothetical protein QNJ63_27910 [Calothrix sp. MO_192.B10]|nr:hypothetical protein [Calothrix sp. MO_192.B10]